MGEPAEEREIVEPPPPPDVKEWSDPEPPRRDHRRSAVTGF